MIRPALLSLTFLALTLPLPVSPATSTAFAQEATEEKGENSGYIWGYLGAAAFSVAIIYGVCKPANRRALNVS